MIDRRKRCKVRLIAISVAFFIFMFECMPSQGQMHSPGLGRTQKQVLSKLEEYFPRVEDSTPVHGKPRRIGRTSDGLALVEIIGNPENVYSASVMIAIPRGIPDILIRNTAICITFIKNILPHWSSGADWFKSAIERIAVDHKKISDMVEVGGATVSVVAIKELSICTLSIKSGK